MLVIAIYANWRLTMEELQQFDVTVAERQLIKSLRSIRTRCVEDKFQLVIEVDGKAWEITMFEGGKLASRGVGETFDEAWGGMAPWWA
jgi:hypothetical protein